MKSYRNDFVIQILFATMTTITLFYYWEKVFTLVNDWEKFNENSLPEKEDIYNHFFMEDITDADYVHAERAYKDFKIRNLGEYHGL